MYASSIFNEKDELQLPTIYGAITTGNNWRFLKYKDNTAFIDLDEYPIENASKVVGILVKMVTDVTQSYSIRAQKSDFFQKSDFLNLVSPLRNPIFSKNRIS
jgi:hypothetical protein